MQPKPMPLYKRLTPVMLFCLLAIFNSCKKSNFNDTDGITDPAVIEAKQWYETKYPQLTIEERSLLTPQSEQAQGQASDLSQKIKPDWKRNAQYERFGKDVIEIPIDASSKYNFGLRNDQKTYDKQYSRTSFLILKNGSKYDAFVMTIVADPAYIKNNLSKLANNTYRKHDADFSGVVLYFTPKGKFLKSYGYKDGKILPAAKASGTGTQQTGGVKTNTLQDPITPMYCIDWSEITYINDVAVSSVFLFRECFYPAGSGVPANGGGGGGGTGTSNMPDCPTTTQSVVSKVVNAVGDPIGPDPGPGDPGFPDPTTVIKGCLIVQPPIDTAKLRKDFPCAADLVMALLKDSTLRNLIAPFLGQPRLSFVTSNNLDWNNGGAFMLGQTFTDGRSHNAEIRLNTKMLQNSSLLAIATAIIHESIHGSIYYNLKAAEYRQADGNVTTGSWLLGLDSWLIIKGLPTDYSNHSVMIEHYFDKAVKTLSDYDNNAHTIKEYQMMMLFGLNTPGDSATVAQKDSLNNRYNRLLSKKGITTTQLNTYWPTQLTATSNKLPTTGCN